MISMTPTLAETLQEAPLQGHIVDFYTTSEHLVRQVADFAEHGLKGPDAVILIATPAHLQGIRQKLSDRHIQIDHLEHTGRLVCLDAETMLRTFMLDENVYWTRFNASIGSTLMGLSQRYGKVRAYGEMVNVLWKQGLEDAALELEGFWNRLSSMYSFCLFCSYSLDVLDPGLSRKALASICHAHSHAFVNAEQHPSA